MISETRVYLFGCLYPQSLDTTTRPEITVQLFPVLSCHSSQNCKACFCHHVSWFFITFVDSEKEREANIAKNRALLAQLDIGLGFPTSKSKPQKGIKPVQASQPRKRKAAELLAPRRQSSRLNKPVVNPHETPKERRKREVFTRYRCIACR